MNSRENLIAFEISIAQLESANSHIQVIDDDMRKLRNKFHDDMRKLQNKFDDDWNNLQQNLVDAKKKRDKLDKVAAELGALERIWLTVKYEERHKAREYGCEWCPLKRRWSIDIYSFYYYANRLPKQWLED